MERTWSGEMWKLNKVGAMKLKTTTPDPYLAPPNGGRNPASEAHVGSSSLTPTFHPINDLSLSREVLIGFRINSLGLLTFPPLPGLR